MATPVLLLVYRAIKCYTLLTIWAISFSARAPSHPRAFERTYLGDLISHVLFARRRSGVIISRNGKDSKVEAWPLRKFEAYAESKLSKVRMCFEFQRRHPDIGCTPVAPGFVKSKIMTPSARDSNWEDWNFIAANGPSGAQSSLDVLLGKEGASPQDGGQVGAFGRPYYSPPIRRLPQFLRIYSGHVQSGALVQFYSDF
uniref:Uncharacterized protein n=1 Tax=Corethron hystrix TaxID=216773 RepID=A0A7S1BC72_9STRA